MKYQDLLLYEAEGAQAGLQGKTRDDCPYKKDTLHWNHWVFGCEMAAAEKSAIDSGKIVFYATGSPEPMMELPVDEAIKRGYWTPRYTK